MDIPLPDGIEVINPYQSKDVIESCKNFYSKYYSDTKGRRLILGINPGRFGAGVTGIPFTDPVRLEKECNIKNAFDKRPELSSEFIYSLINTMGGPKHFYSHYFIGAVSPLGFLKDGKNFNYYDSKELTRALKPFIIKTLVEQIACGINSKKCYCLGQGKNFEYLSMINSELKLFSQIIPLPHPRWVMQYRRKKLNEFLEQTAKVLST
ncbi:MAG TPA: uracil-DNA glycosylase family protein [Bacteroidales bacterium]